jgi:macrolide phosphotransferase
MLLAASGGVLVEYSLRRTIQMTISGYNDQTRIEEIIQIARNAGLHLREDKMELNESGMDFQVAFAHDENGTAWVLRLPRREDVLSRADNEKQVLKLVSRLLPVAVPDWRIYTPEIIAYPILPGIPAANLDMAAGGYAWNINHEELPEAFTDSLAETLAALHAVDHEEARAAGIRIKSPMEARQEYAGFMEEVRSKLGVAEELWERWQRWINDDSCWPEHSALVHGDLHPPHILVDTASQRVSGFIDWTEAEVSNPAKDFNIYYALFGETGLRALLSKYEKAGGRVWPRMVEHIAGQWDAYPVLVAKFALLSGNEDTMKMARNALGLEG